MPPENWPSKSIGIVSSRKSGIWFAPCDRRNKSALMRSIFRGGCWILLCGTLWSGDLPTHTVTRGETLFSIARQHNVTVAQLLKTNPGLQPEKIHAGDIVKLPADPP
ncbi:LysM peptidoglycan-binding domain-containing protein, partial [bacterium]|nr:LysM peptidoglycan-binding domain-containing protein [bacterium]